MELILIFKILMVVLYCVSECVTVYFRKLKTFK